MVVRELPFDIEYTWARAEFTVVPGGPRSPSGEASRYDGGSYFHILAENGGSMETHCGVGIYFKPPSRNGILTVYSNPQYHTVYFNAGICSRALTRAWLGFVIESFNASDNFFDRGLVTQREMVFDRDIPWVFGREERTFGNTGFPINTQVRIDGNHWYIIWVMCGGLVRAASRISFANERFIMRVRNINWSYAAI